MTAPAKFDLIHSPLEAGRTLIEASAGTGKTYTIAGIVLRLILEQHLGIREILVTTYTELATAELRDRIRRLLHEALLGFQNGDSPNELVKPLLNRFGADADAIARLRVALESFDEAPIHTIHGFCQRMLKDRAFESGALFDAEMITDQSHVLREIVDDFWRAHFYACNPLLAAAAVQNGITPETLLRDLDDLVNKPTLEVIPPLGDQLAAARTALTTAWEKARDLWIKQGEEVRAIFANPKWAIRPFNLPDLVRLHLAELDRIWPEASGAMERVESIGFFASSAIAKGTSKRAGASPAHEFFDRCEEFGEAEQKLLLCLQASFFSWARAEMKRRKIQRNVVSFDDLLTRLHDSLGEAGGPALAGSIRTRFRAALIDEFQDTDPIQYAIFERIYEGSDATVFFIGDPKQAIYGFRGADVFTYIEAARAATRRYTLPKNWRSETGMVAAVNALFRLRADAFVLDGISFQPVEAAGRMDDEPLTIEGAEEPALQLWLAQSEITSKDAHRLLPALVADEIARLLNGETKIGARQVIPPDIAVLVSTNDEARQVQEELLRRNVPAVIYSAANVFQSREAEDLATILAAVVEPAHEKRVRAALATEIIGLTSDALDALEREERAWEGHVLQFQRYHQIWRDGGFIRMLRTILLEQDVRRRLLRYPDGERRLTNVLHLAELLHRMCTESRLGMTGLRKRLAEMMRTESFQNEEYEVRLERDEAAVRIVTVHKSKGLEYGIVFCPFAWSNPWVKKESNVVVHADGRLILDLERTEKNKELQLREKLADKVRSLYVALTRARHRAYLVWGNFKYGQESAPAHLLGKWSESGVEALAREPSLARADLPVPSREIYHPEKSAAADLAARVFHRQLDRSYGISSFTKLITGQELEPIAPEDDTLETMPAEEETPAVEQVLQGMFAFPRGTGPGTCLHHIFEELNFSDLTNLSEVVRRKLRAFSIPGFDEVVETMVRKVVAAPLRADDPSLTLARVETTARLPELEFYFPIADVTNEDLARLFQDKRLKFQPMSGFMKGFIDLVFEADGRYYIVDWKSNWLGPDLESYTEEAMAAEMARKFYNLQLHIYVGALHRFLSARLPGYAYEKNFGGACYVFLRGVEPGRPELGVYRARPSAKFVQSLGDLLGHGA